MQKRLKRCYQRNCADARTLIHTRNWGATLAGKRGDGGGKRVQLADKASVDFKLSLVALIAADPDMFRTVIEGS